MTNVADPWTSVLPVHRGSQRALVYALVSSIGYVAWRVFDELGPLDNAARYGGHADLLYGLLGIAVLIVGSVLPGVAAVLAVREVIRTRRISVTVGCAVALSAAVLVFHAVDYGHRFPY